MIIDWKKINLWKISDAIVYFTDNWKYIASATENKWKWYLIINWKVLYSTYWLKLIWFNNKDKFAFIWSKSEWDKNSIYICNKKSNQYFILDKKLLEIFEKISKKSTKGQTKIYDSLEKKLISINNKMKWNNKKKEFIEYILYKVKEEKLK